MSFAAEGGGMGGSESEDSDGDKKMPDIPQSLPPIDKLKIETAEPAKPSPSGAAVVEQAKRKLIEEIQENEGSPSKKRAVATFTNWGKLSSEVATRTSLESQDLFREHGLGTAPPPPSPVRDDEPTTSGDDAKIGKNVEDKDEEN